MKIYVRKIWASICAIWISMAGTLTAFATEQGTDAADVGSGFMVTMDILQKVCLVIVVIVVIIAVGFYAAKMILKKLSVPQEEKKDNAEQNDQ